MRMASISLSHLGTLKAGAGHESSWRRAVQGWIVWISPKPSLEEVKDLIKWFSEVVDLLEEDLREESKGWAASVVVMRSLGQRVLVDLVAREFRLHAGLKGEVAGFGLKMGFFFFSL